QRATYEAELTLRALREGGLLEGPTIVQDTGGSESVARAINEAAGVLLGKEVPGQTPEQVRVGSYFKNAVPFYQTLRRVKNKGVGVADDILFTLQDLYATQTRLSSNILGSWLIRDEAGRRRFIPDDKAREA